MGCPTSQELIFFLAGELTESRFEKLAEHLEECEQCGDVLETLETEEPLDAQVYPALIEEQSWAESLGARQLTQRLLDRNSLSDDQLGPDAIGRIKIIRYLASGSFGRVFIGWDEELQRHVAVKLPRAGMFIDDQSREEIRREARQAARVEHPGIVPIYDIGTDDNHDIYIISGFVDGLDLKQWQMINQPTIEESLKLVIKIAEIIEFAHQHQLVHRDIKPGNILIDKEGKPHLVDFGLSINCDDPGNRSPQGLVGTPAYLPPDYLDYVHPPIDPRGDLYSLGVVLFELLTGARPYDLEPATWQQTLRTVDPTRPRKLNQRISRQLERICLQAIDRDPRKRFQSAGELSRKLQQVLEKTRETTTTVPERSSLKTWGKFTAVSTALVLIVAVAWATSARLRDGERNQFLIPIFQTAPEAVDLDDLANFAPVSVGLTTDPPGAHLAIVPLSKSNWEPIPSSTITPDETTPCQVELLPGDYLIEAVVPGLGFHQVIRHVDAVDQNSPPDVREKIELAAISIPESSTVSRDLVRIPEGEFEFGLKPATEHRRVQEFLIQAHEPTYADYRRVMGELTPAMMKGLNFEKGVTDLHRPVGYLTFHDALQFAEASGLRLLTETEWEYVASNAGTTTFPWGNNFPEEVEQWEELSALDQTINPRHESVFGLYSEALEWVSHPMPQLRREVHYFLVRGGPFQIREGQKLQEVHIKYLERGVRMTLGTNPSQASPRVGARFGRDLQPRYVTPFHLISR